jgi:hypothetical protein
LEEISEFLMKWQGELEEREAQVLAAEEVICERLRELEEGRSTAEAEVARREAALEVSLVARLDSCSCLMVCRPAPDARTLVIACCAIIEGTLHSAHTHF